VIDVGITRWQAWTAETEPDVSFLPPLLRRRCGRLTRMMLHVAFRVGGPDDLATVPVVFASRYGDMAGTITLLQALARREPLTAAGFSHSVHNAPPGLFSIAAKNRGMASAVAAAGDTFGGAFLEAVAAMHRGGHDRALLVVADDALPDVFARYQEEPAGAYAVALALGPEGTRLRFEPGVGTAPAPTAAPHALEFVRWLDDRGETLTLGTRTPYTWTRSA
jgi:hypothetical protein